MAGAASPLDVHFTPTSASWLNAVEGFFAKLTRSASSAACSDLSLICRSPSTASSPRQTSIPNPSSGPPTQNACSPLSNGGSKRQSNQSTSIWDSLANSLNDLTHHCPIIGR